MWEATLEIIKEKISKPSFETWLKETTAVQLDQNTFVIGVPNDFIKEWLENHYTTLITEALFELTGAELSIKFAIPEHIQADDSSEINRTNKQALTQASYETSETMLNPKRSEERRVGKEKRAKR